uniref:Dynein heavy chain AAA module D4 domain-containing protein n=1 Tax=Parascaris univalens TaxID=6257 RepID=A0A915BMA6_PARUN
LINRGGLPMRVFTPEVTDELIEKMGFISSAKEMTKFEYYNGICERISTNVHLMLCCSRNSFDAIVSEFPNFLRYCIVDHYGEWSYEDKFDIATAQLQRCTALNEDHIPLFCEQIMKVHSFMPNFGINSTPSSFLSFIKTFSFLLKRRV